MAELKHFGIPGMRWGHRKAQTSSGSSGGRKTAFGPTNQDGRKVNKLFGKRNRTAIRKFIFGDEDKALANWPILKTKYKQMTPEQKKVARDRTAKVLAVMSSVSIAILTSQIVALSKMAHEDEV